MVKLHYPHIMLSFVSLQTLTCVPTNKHITTNAITIHTFTFTAQSQTNTLQQTDTHKTQTKPNQTLQPTLYTQHSSYLASTLNSSRRALLYLNLPQLVQGNEEVGTLVCSSPPLHYPCEKTLVSSKSKKITTKNTYHFTHIYATILVQSAFNKDWCVCVHVYCV
jgi:hypothetical protein